MDNPVTGKIVTALVLSALATSSASAAGDPANGRALFGRCVICHKITKDGGNGLGPNLFGIGGRKAGAVPGFAYSTAMKNSDITWSQEKLAAYIGDPKGTVPGNRMMFVGISDHSQADDLAAYLMTLK